MTREEIDHKRENEAMEEAIKHIDKAREALDSACPGPDVFRIDSSRADLEHAKDTLRREQRDRGLL